MFGSHTSSLATDWYLSFGAVCDGFLRLTSGVPVELLQVSIAVSRFYPLTLSSNGGSRTIATVYGRSAQLQNATRGSMQTASVPLQSYSL